MNEKNTLENELKKFDGVAVSLLSEARIKCRDTPDYFDELIHLTTVLVNFPSILEHDTFRTFKLLPVVFDTIPVLPSPIELLD